MQTTAQFWDRIAPKYAARPIKDETAYRTTLDIVRDHLRPDDRALELGAGTASTAVALAPSVAAMTATDYSGEMARIGQGRARDAGANTLTVRQASVAEALAWTEDWTVILAFNLLHLLPELETRLAEIRARLPEGGRFISKTPCLAEMSVLVRMIIPVMQAVGYAPYVRSFTRRELEDMITRAGFVIERSCVPGKAGSARLIVARAV